MSEVQVNHSEKSQDETHELGNEGFAAGAVALEVSRGAADEDADGPSAMGRDAAGLAIAGLATAGRSAAGPAADGPLAGGQTGEQDAADQDGEPSREGGIFLPVEDLLPLEVATDDEADRKPALDYLVVGFGSSAGGMQPFREVLELLPPSTGMAFVLVPHLAADQISHLTSITEQFTKMPVHAIADGVRPEPDHLYILQPNQTVQMQGGRFHVEPRRAEERIPRPIDLFFRSLGADQHGHAIGVVLSGADADGALGLKALRGEGGVAIVQSPDTAQHSSMPRNSILSDHVDLILSPADIAVELARLAKQFVQPDVRQLDKDELPTDNDSYTRILNLLRASSGLELRQYKPDTIRRRIARRMLLLRMDSLAEYVQYAQARKDELKNLQEDVLIGVTRFFRDPQVWEAVVRDILPTFFENRAQDTTIRVWSAGCSSGEEAYSFAMVLLEYMSSQGIDASVQIFGTDASERSIELARTGIYPDSLNGEISPERLRRFFIKVPRGFQINKRVRDLCVFAKQNLSADPPFSHMDFVLCRNVMIYFKQALQQQIISTFHYALKQGGFLILGSSESLREYDDAFTPTDRKNKIYSKLGASLQGGYNLPTSRFTGRETPSPKPFTHPVGTGSEQEMQRVADRVVLARFGPPGLIVDERMNVLQARGQTSAYVELPSGAVSLNLLRILRESLVTPVREALERSIAEGIPVMRTAEFAPKPGEQRHVEIDVIPIAGSLQQENCYLVLFAEMEDQLPGTLPNVPAQLTSIPDQDRINSQLRHDLSSTRVHLQSLIEEREARNQELVSANEEIQSANEELQSTNEELETTKEELQSANEELQTVNDELQQRNAVLTQTGNDLSNLLTSVNIPLLMLTEDLRVRQFTAPMEKLLNIRASDIGRSIREIRLQISIEDIEPLLNGVLETLIMREEEVQDREGRWHLLRVRPYRTTENKIEGLVMMLVDIHQLRHSQQSLQEAKEFADSVVECVPVPVVVLNTDLEIQEANTSFRKLSGLEMRQLLGRSLPDLFGRLWGISDLDKKLQPLKEGAPDTAIVFEHESSTADKRVLEVKALALKTDGDRVILLTMEDITLRREAERKGALERTALQREVEQTGRTLLQAQGELRELAAHLFTMQEEEREYVARELHDDVAQRLSLAALLCQEAQAAADPAARTLALDKVAADISAINSDVRTISHRLHPAILHELGLATALKQLVDEFGKREGMFATLITANMPESVDPTVATSLYRVTQEALRNVAKHAGKTHVKVILEGRGDNLYLEVRDFGIGYDQEAEEGATGLGLISITERTRIAGGRSKVESSLGRGTSIMVEVPIHGRT